MDHPWNAVTWPCITHGTWSSASWRPGAYQLVQCGALQLQVVTQNLLGHALEGDGHGVQDEGAHGLAEPGDCIAPKQ